jgi:glycine/D-amino acid oxidase-like deaminating enzyme
MSGRSFRQVRRHYSNELTIRLANRGFEVLRDWTDEVGVGDPGHLRLGYLLLVPPETVEACKGNVELGRSLGVDTSFLEPAEVSEVEPLVAIEGVGGAAFEPDGGIVDVQAMVFSWVMAAIGHGLEARFGVGVSDIEVTGGRVTGVRTTTGERISCDRVVNAAGCWAPELVSGLGLDLPIRLFRLQMGYVRQPAGAPTLGVALTDAAGGLVMRPDVGLRALAVVYEPHASSPEAVPEDAGVDPSYAAVVRRAVEARVPAYAGAAWDGGVSGFYDVTPDWHPILGWAPGIEGLYLAVGWSGHGLKLSPAVGEIVAAEVLGVAPPFDVSQLRLERFERGQLMHLAYGPGARA